MYEIMCFDENGKSVTHLTQWDINQSLIIKGLGLDTNPEFHFCNKKSTEALVVSSSLDLITDTITVKIPNQLLEEPYPIFVYVYFYLNAESAKTIAEIKLPVRQRVKPSDYEYVENIETVTAESIKVDILRQINSLSLKYEETEDENYKISLFNADGLEITNCELPISDVVEKIINKLNNYTLKSETLDTLDYRITLYNSDNIAVTYCDIMTSKILSQHNEDIEEIKNDIDEIYEKFADIGQGSSKNYYELLTDYTLALNPTYSVYTESYTHYTSDTYGTSVSISKTNYNPDNGDALIVWVDYEMLKLNTDYSITTAGESLYVVVFSEELVSGSNIILQVWHKPQSNSTNTVIQIEESTALTTILTTGETSNIASIATVIEEEES